MIENSNTPEDEMPKFAVYGNAILDTYINHQDVSLMDYFNSEGINLAL